MNQPAGRATELVVCLIAVPGFPKGSEEEAGDKKRVETIIRTNAVRITTTSHFDVECSITPLNTYSPVSTIEKAKSIQSCPDRGEAAAFNENVEGLTAILGIIIPSNVHTLRHKTRK